MTDDYWGHVRHASGSISDMLYIEWKYFNIITRDTQALITYSVGDPKNRTGRGKGLVFITVFHRGRVYSETIGAPLDKCTYSTDGPDADIAGNRIARESGKLRISGEGSKLRWT